jgi:hypothetical protein
MAPYLVMSQTRFILLYDYCFEVLTVASFLVVVNKWEITCR